jgi:hypothetical protein
MTSTAKRRGWFSSIENPRTRRVVQIIAWLVVTALFGYIVGTVVDKAVGAEPRRPAECVNMHQQPCRTAAAKFAVRKFKRHKMGHTAATERTLFEHPRAARKAMIRKIGHALDRHARRDPAARAVSPWTAATAGCAPLIAAPRAPTTPTPGASTPASWRDRTRS